MKGLSVLNRTASTSSSMRAVSSAMVLRSVNAIPAPFGSRLRHAPLDGFAATMDESTLVRTLDTHFLGRGPGLRLERHGRAVGLEPIVKRAVERRERLQLVELVLLLEHLGIALECDRRIEEAGNPDDVELARHRVRRRVRAEKEARIARGRGLAQREPVALALDHRH